MSCCTSLLGSPCFRSVSLPCSVGDGRYAAYVVFALLWIPASAHFRAIVPPPCEYRFGAELALESFRNIPHILLFAVFFIMTLVQVRQHRYAIVIGLAACLLTGMIVEWEEGMTAVGHCRLRDLIPDGTGALLGCFTYITSRALVAPLRRQ